MNIYLLIKYFIERVHKPRHAIPLRLFIKVSKKDDDKQIYKTNGKILELSSNIKKKNPKNMADFLLMELAGVRGVLYRYRIFGTPIQKSTRIHCREYYACLRTGFFICIFFL